MKNEIKLFEQLAKEKWYTQTGSGVSIYICASASSGFKMQAQLGFSYKFYSFITKNGLVEMNYRQKDLVDLWKIIKKKMADNPNYIEESKIRYEKTMEDDSSFFKKMDKLDLKKVSDDVLRELVIEGEKVQSDSVGLGHIIEPISLVGEKEFRSLLADQTEGDGMLNDCFISLTSPSRLSFISREENDLAKIALLDKKKQKSELEAHREKYYWIQNSYFGPQELDLAFFEKRLKKVRQTQENVAVNEEKERLMNRLNLTNETRELARALELATIWQDERKENVLKTISYFGKLVDEVARRLKVEKELGGYMTLAEMRDFRDNKIPDFGAELKRRQQGAFYYVDKNRELVLSGKEFDELFTKKSEDYKDIQEIRGMIANGGSVLGKVVICRSYGELCKVKQGDILVTSMTRPEFMLVLRKVAGIITDEGGITSHAAIVARELGIPAIIGTKVATKILKDGMMVELKANHGLVKIIKDEK